jgi:hypothetical protein
LGSPVNNGKELYHEGHEVLKGGIIRLALRASFVVTFVPFVVENGIPVKNGRIMVYKSRNTLWGSAGPEAG